MTVLEDPPGVLSPRTPIAVRCVACLARFGEALGKPPRPCPRCGFSRALAAVKLALAR